MKTTIKLLQLYAHSEGRDMQSVFTELLDFFLETFIPERLVHFKGDMASLLASRKESSPTMFKAMAHWLRCAEKDIAENGVSDFFGELYESMFLGKSKASVMGQFFTPMPLCQAMASLISKDTRKIVTHEIINEPSCGSGRNVLAHWQRCDKSHLIEYCCEDLDPTSVKMCALNMMINGMYGHVICHDSLDPESFHFGYVINEIRYPLPSPYFSIRAISRSHIIAIRKRRKE